MKNKKLWIFIGMIVLILILNHIFGWSSYLGNTENLKFLENMVQENLVLAMLIYTSTYDCKLCRSGTSGGDICNCCRAGIWTGTWNDLLLSSDNAWSYGSICCRTIFLTGHYQTDGDEEQVSEKMAV